MLIETALDGVKDARDRARHLPGCVRYPCFDGCDCNPSRDQLVRDDRNSGSPP